MYRVLIPEPIAPLDRVVHVPAPVVLRHVTERGVDAALRGDGVGACREEFGDAGGAETGGGEACGRAEAGAAGTEDDGVVVVVDYWVGE